MPETNSTSKKQHHDLFKKSFKSVCWTILFQIVTQLLFFGRLIAITHFLTRKDMGLIGIAWLVTSILGVFTQTGFQAALVRQRRSIEPFLDTVWTLELLRGIGLFGLAFATAPLVAAWTCTGQDVAEATKLIQIGSLVLVIRSLTDVAVVRYSKDLSFASLFKLDAMAKLVGVFVTVTLLIAFGNVWAVVFGRLSDEVTRCLLSHAFSSSRRNLKIDWAKAKELWKFSRHVSLNILLVFLLNQGDDYFVLLYLGAAPLGLYQFSYKLSNLPTTQITTVLSKVMFPAYAIIQDDRKRLREAYLKVLSSTAFVAIPLSALICVLAPDFFKLFLGEDWQNAANVAQVLAIFGFFRALGATRGPILMASGHPQVISKMLLLNLAVAVLLVYPLTREYGLVGTAASLVLIQVITSPYQMIKFAQVLKTPIWPTVKPIVAPLIGGLCMVICLKALQWTFLWGKSIISFMGLIIIGAISYLLALFMLRSVSGFDAIGPIYEDMRTVLSKDGSKDVNHNV